MKNKKLLIILIALVLLVGVGGGAYWYMQRNSTPVTDSSVSQTSSSETISTETDQTPPSIQPSAQAAGISSVILNSSSSGPDVGPLSAQTSFSTSTDVIYATVLLNPTTTADKAVLKITYLADSSELGPVNATVKTQGTTKYAVFQMKKPANGWPAGNYHALFALPTGESKETTFSIQ